ncbi:hypothetical protein M5X00_17690 [Paenibacillus alvei]|uniref:hypothetical protein n=1 Tax=Paenibacillus alvei TaxID=44250 RepID=UPI000288890E|nr:hypothetical protein [Paenibacillus alvei]EJW16908.1 hypothetical protein PAV_5c04910 [Paenibacillus alvei DSM 29]EJW19905.1 hypothetical protein PAV_1c08930 [Paenibacillus alvei DSM 29]MCY9543273.1 hypothetical protein [Paenibacillus alvei]MCY9708470.1 hypothetical protein [Paenibacillus alvei]MCY9732193.1 hypothetical protein [Paenibacillus alvei]
MKSFNDFLNDDLLIFVNPAEMGEKAIVDGKELCVTITHNSIDERKRLISRGYDIDPRGVYNVMMTMYVRLSDLGFVPVKGQPMIVNEKEYIVIGAGEEKGLVTVRLERNGHDYI